MSGVTFNTSWQAASQWFFVGVWLGAGLVCGGAIAGCSLALIVKQIGRLLS